MKIRTNSHGSETGGFLIVFMCLVVLTVGGCTVYHVRRLAQRIPVSSQPLPSGYSNDLSNISGPAGSTPQVVRQNHYWVDAPEDFLLAELQPEPEPFGFTLRVLLNEAGLSLVATNASNWQTVDMAPFVNDLGLPEAWADVPPGVPVQLQRSTNMMDWTYWTTIYVVSNGCSLVRDTDRRDLQFYRAITQ